MSSLNYNECDIDPGRVASARDAFDDLYVLISGRSDEHHSITEPVGFDFTDLIGEGLRDAAEENHHAWRGSMSACILAYGVLDQTREAVVTYKEKIEEIEGRLSVYLGSLGENLPPEAGTVIESYHAEAEDAWNNLVKECGDSEDMLREGATPENIRALADGGYFGDHVQVGYYITGDLDYYYVDDTHAETIATHLEDAVLNGYAGSIEILEDNPEYLALLGSVVSRALTAQGNGESLLDSEIEFLDTLFGELSDIEGNDGVLDFVRQIDASEHISDPLREDIRRHLANGSLVLSNEDIGGGMERLPQDMQDTANGPDRIDDGSTNTVIPVEYEAWATDFDYLSNFLGSSGDSIKGGTDFSTRLLATSAEMLPESGNFQGPTEEDSSQWPSDETFQEIIDIASRNPEANHIILTGDDFEGNSYDHHNNHEGITPENALETLYTHDWEDDGAAIRGITDWISSDSGPDATGVPERGREEALASFMELMDDSDFSESMFGSGHDVMDDEGIEWLNVSVSHLNPQLAEGFGDIFLHYMDEFAETDGLGGGSESNDEGDVFGNRWNPETERLELSPASRLAFTQLIMGDPNTAERIYGEVLLNTGQTMEEYSTNTGERDHIPTVLAGSLQGLVEEALARESEMRETNSNEEVDHRNSVTNGAIDLLGSGAGDLGAPGFAVEVAKFAAKEALELEENEAEQNVRTVGEWAESEIMQGFAISALANEDPSLMAGFVDLGITKEDENGNPYVPVDHTEWDVVTSSGVLATEFDGVSELDWADGESSAGHAVYRFLDSFGINRQKWENE